MHSRRVVVTGVGAISGAGLTARDLARATREGRSAMWSITRFDASDFPVDIAAEVPVAIDLGEDLVHHWASAAVDMAVEDARFKGAYDPSRVGLIAGTAFGSIAAFERNVTTGDFSRQVGMWIGPDLAHRLAQQANARGFSIMVNSSFASGADAIGGAVQRIRRGDLDAAIAGGAEAPITPSIVAGFTTLGALADGSLGASCAIRPFDAERRGCGLGEGAAFIALEEREAALRRGAAILAEVAGYGTSADAFHITQLPDDGNGLRRAMADAIADAGIAPHAIGYVNAHGTGTDMNDRVETSVIREVFGAHADRLPVSSTKAVTGHLLGAAGAIEALITILALVDGLIPPTINWANRATECDLDYVPNEPRQADIRYALSNSMGFGGHNAVLVFARG